MPKVYLFIFDIPPSPIDNESCLCTTAVVRVWKLIFLKFPRTNDSIFIENHSCIDVLAVLVLRVYTMTSRSSSKRHASRSTVSDRETSCEHNVITYYFVAIFVIVFSEISCTYLFRDVYYRYIRRSYSNTCRAAFLHKCARVRALAREWIYRVIF